MKKQRLLSVTFVLVVVSLLAVTPVFANAEGECSHAAPTVASLSDCVTHAAKMGHIDNQGGQQLASQTRCRPNCFGSSTNAGRCS